MTKKILVWLILIFFVENVSVVQAQQLGKILRVGFLDGSTASGIAILVKAFLQELSKVLGETS